MLMEERIDHGRGLQDRKGSFLLKAQVSYDID